MSKDDATWLNVAYVAFAIMIAYFTYQALETVGVQTGWVERFDWYDLTATVLSVVVALVSTWQLRRKKERHDYFLSAIAELRKVTWPSWKDTKRMTIIVCAVVAVFAVLLAGLDSFFAWALKTLIV